MKPEYKKILVINLGGIGDVLLSSPALRGIKASFPNVQISMLVVERVHSMVADLPYIEKSAILYMGRKGFIKNLKTLLDLRRESYDLAINMRTLVSWWGSLKMRLLLGLINPQLKAGRNTGGRGGFFDVSVKESDVGEKYETEYDIDIAKAIGAEVLDNKIEFLIGDKESKKIGMLLDKENISVSDLLIGIHPGGESSHRWPIENFAETIDALNKRSPAKFVITGSINEAYLAERLRQITKAEIINLCGRLNLSESAALINRCALYICNDTGPMHIAAILKVPLVAIFGAGYLIRFDPRNISAKAKVINNQVDCAPCNNKSCKSLKCLKQIYPQEVVQAAITFLDNHV